jgi:hypothetical protein
VWKVLENIITHYEILIAQEQGRLAFSASRARQHNPYLAYNYKTLVEAWWNGWDAALQETNAQETKADKPERNFKPIKQRVA